MPRKKRTEQAFPGRNDKGVVEFQEGVTASDDPSPERRAEGKQLAQKALSVLSPEEDRGLRVAFVIPAPRSLRLSRKQGATPKAQAEMDAIERRALGRLRTQRRIDSLKE